MAFCKARLIELNQQFTDPKPGGKNIPVQFNPETLKITYANQLVEPKGGDKAAGTAGRQFVGAGTTKLALQLWFDVGAQEPVTDEHNTGEQGMVDDVRRLTQHVVFFMTPQKSDNDPKMLAPPGVRFEWGTFAFEGMVEGMEESLEYFSPEGKPLRASMTLTLSKQKILARKPSDTDQDLPFRPGHDPLKVAKQGDSLQRMADASGKQDWRSIASANGIEDPLRISPGQFVNLNASVGAGSVASIGVGATPFDAVGAALQGPSQVSGSAGLNASLGGALSGSLSLG